MLDGRFPPEWRHCRLSDVAILQTGLAKGRKNVPNPVQRPYLRVANVQDGRLNLTEIKHIVLSADELRRYELKINDVLLTEGGDFDKLGRGTIWRGEIPGCVHQNHVFAVRTDRTALLPEFLTAWTGSVAGRRYFLACSKQTTNLASVNATQVRHLPLAIPPIAEQQRIIAALATWDQALDLTRRVDEAKRRFKRGLMQELLTGRRRFKEFDGSAWRECTIGELLEVVSCPVEWDDSATYDLLSLRRRSGGVFLRSRTKGEHIKTKQLFEVRSGDFLVSKMQVLHGALGLVRPKFDGMTVSGSYVVLRNRRPDSLRIEFFDHLSRLPQMYRIALLSSYGVHIEKMTFNLEWYLRAKIRVPQLLAEQTAIVETLDALDREIRLLQQLRDALVRQRRGMAELLLAGKVRISA